MWLPPGRFGAAAARLPACLPACAPACLFRAFAGRAGAGARGEEEACSIAGAIGEPGRRGCCCGLRAQLGFAGLSVRCRWALRGQQCAPPRTGRGRHTSTCARSDRGGPPGWRSRTVEKPGTARCAIRKQTDRLRANITVGVVGV
eukprot:365451-Chlamydomonas_euryale.AAC.10